MDTGIFKIGKKQSGEALFVATLKLYSMLTGGYRGMGDVYEGDEWKRMCEWIVAQGSEIGRYREVIRKGMRVRGYFYEESEQMAELLIRNYIDYNYGRPIEAEL